MTTSFNIIPSLCVEPRVYPLPKACFLHALNGTLSDLMPQFMIYRINAFNHYIIKRLGLSHSAQACKERQWSPGSAMGCIWKEPFAPSVLCWREWESIQAQQTTHVQLDLSV